MANIQYCMQLAYLATLMSLKIFVEMGLDINASINGYSVFHCAVLGGNILSFIFITVKYFNADKIISPGYI